MDFRFSLNDEALPRICLHTGDKQAVAIFGIGSDEETRQDYFMHVGLDYSSPLGTEFYFVIRVLDSSGKHVRDIWSGLEVARAINRDEKTIISLVVATAIRKLLKKAKPERVHWSAYDPNQPRKALIKYTMVAYAMSEIGYKVVKSDSYQGRRCWWAELNGEVE